MINKETNLKKFLLAANWKMNMDAMETEGFFKDLSLKSNDSYDVYVAVPFTNIYLANKTRKYNDIKIGAQNIYFEDKGAFTGEISTKMIKSCGADFVIIGHSERREIFGECDEMINKKVLKAIDDDVEVILCLGETLSEREDGKHFEKIERQLKADLVGVDAAKLDSFAIAYEPIWAIGTGKSASKEDAEEMCRFVREKVKEMNPNLEAKLRVLYGGSVKEANAADLVKEENIDGFLIGGASLKTESFEAIAKEI